MAPLKFLSEPIAGMAEGRTRFLYEAQAAALIDPERVYSLPIRGGRQARFHRHMALMVDLSLSVAGDLVLHGGSVDSPLYQ